MFSFKLDRLPELWEMDVVQCSGAWNNSPRKAVQHLLEIIYKGSAVYTINGQEHVLNEGDMVFIPQNELWQSRTNDCPKCRFFYIFFMVDEPVVQTDAQKICAQVMKANKLIHSKRYYCPITPPAGNFNQILIPGVSTLKDSDLQKIKLIVSQMQEERDNPATVSGLKLSLWFAQILSQITEITIARIQEENCIRHIPHLNPIVTQTVRYMRLHYNNKIMLADLCQECNVSPQYLIHLFKSEFSQTPVEYLTNIRLNVAKEMMLGSSLTCKEIAAEVGFDNPLYFSRVFRKYEGVPPREYRKKFTKEE